MKEVTVDQWRYWILAEIGVMIFLFVDYELYITYCVQSRSKNSNLKNRDDEEVELTEETGDEKWTWGIPTYGSTEEPSRQEEYAWNSMLDTSKWYHYISNSIYSDSNSNSNSDSNSK